MYRKNERIKKNKTIKVMVNISANNNPNVKLGCAIQRVRERTCAKLENKKLNNKIQICINSRYGNNYTIN
jgi:hypothetical protein